MKKLLIAFAAVAVAAGVQAAAVTWQWTGTAYNGYLNSGASSTSYEGKAAQAGTMYIFNANASGVTQAAVLAAVLAGGDYASLSIDNYTTANGQMGSGAKKTLASDYTTFAPVRYDSTKAANFADYFYAMVLDDNVFISDTFSAQIQTAKDTNLSGTTVATQSAKFQGLGSDGFVAGGWYSTSVPEPTSGLLLILGVAGLALRRKHA